MGDAEDRLWSLLESTLEDIKRSVKAIDRKLNEKLDKRDLDALTNTLALHEKRIEKLEAEEAEWVAERRTTKRLEDRSAKLRRWAFEAALSLASTAALIFSVFHP